MHECAELVARLKGRKSQEALFKMSEDFQLIRRVFSQNFRSPEGTGCESDAETVLLSACHPLVSTVQWAYLDQYLEAHGGLPNDALAWARLHVEYPMRLHRALLEYF